MADTPSVLFVCVHNAGRSQMAAGWLRHLAGVVGPLIEVPVLVALVYASLWAARRWFPGDPTVPAVPSSSRSNA